MNIKRGKFILGILAVLFYALAAIAQDATISGVVRDVNTHREIRGVNIYVKGSQLGTSSDVSGRFSFQIPGASRQMIIAFQHIAYEPREIPLDSVAAMRHVDLQPRIIPLQEVEVEAQGLQILNIEKDLPQTTSIIQARNFEIRGYVDAGDLLNTDHSVQVEEELSGRKTAAIRGGNADEVVVLYNGVKMNNTFDNVFDLSLVDLEDVERFEIIKGSNTTLYGPEAFSGVINIIPKIQQDYNIRFQQRLGTYRSGNWGLHLYQRLNRLNGSYSFKRGGATRNLGNRTEEESRLENTALHHTANLTYNFSDGAGGKQPSSLSVMYIYSSLDYDNQRDGETLSDFNHLLSLKYAGSLSRLGPVDLSLSLRRLDEEQILANGLGALNRSIQDRALYVNAEKRFALRKFELLFAYQFQHAKLHFIDERRDFAEQPVGLESAVLQRDHHGLVGIVKYHDDPGSDFVQNVDLDFSMRHDRVHDEQFDPILRGEAAGDAVGYFGENAWHETIAKFALNMSGYRNDLAFNGYLSFGANVKFPTLFQQINSPSPQARTAFQPNLNPEKNRSVEIGFVVTKDLQINHDAIYGVQMAGNFFQNYYENKFRLFTSPLIPVVFYDNVPTARISGIEARPKVFLFRKKVTIELGLSRYFISEQAAFPFKSDFKRTLNLALDHEGFSFQIHWFKEGSQSGVIRQTDGSFALVELPSYRNVDLHLSKTFEISKLKLFANASARNLLNDDDVNLLGLAIRDRRFYLTIGAQY